MTRIDDVSPDPADGDGAMRRQLVADLEAYYAAPAPADVRAAVRATVRAQALTARRVPPRHGPLVLPIRRVAAVAAAVLLALGGLAGYLRMQAPTPVSAQTILRRAAAVLTAAHPDEVTNDVSRVSYSPNRAQDISQDVYIQGPLTLTVDQWTQLDATGAISRQVTTATTPAGALVFRALRQGREVRTYGARGPGRDWIVDVTRALESDPTPVVNSGFLWLDLARLVSEARAGAASYIRLLPAQTVAGAPVDVVEIGAPADATILYIDARTYAIRGVDEVESWSGHGQRHLALRMRLLRHAVVAPAVIPAGTFALAAPAGVTVLHPTPTIQLLDVATAVHQSPTPVPVLGRDIWGLRLQAITREQLIARAAAIDYVYGTPAADLVGLKRLTVGIVTGPDAASVAAATGRAAGQPPAGRSIATTIMGQVVPARYRAMGGTMGGSYALTYQQGIATVSLTSYGLTKAEFFTAVAALVDGTSHPQTRARLQGELDRSLTVWHVAGGTRGG